MIRLLKVGYKFILNFEFLLLNVFLKYIKMFEDYIKLCAAY